MMVLPVKSRTELAQTDSTTTVLDASPRERGIEAVASANLAGETATNIVGKISPIQKYCPGL